MKKRNGKGAINFIETILFSLFNFIKNFWALLFFILLMGKCGYDFHKGNEMRDQLKNSPKNFTRGIVTEEKYYWGNNPVTQLNTYKYSFVVNNVEYWGVCPNKKYHPGDVIEVKYVIENPEYNKSRYE